MDRPAPVALRPAPLRDALAAVPRRILSSHRLLLAVAAVGPGLVIASSQGRLDSDGADRAVVVAVGALVVLGTTVATIVRTARRPDTRSALMAVSFLAMAIVLLVRAVATAPGVLASPGVVRIAEMTTLPMGALVLALSAAPELRQRRRLDLVVQSGPALAIFLLGVGVIALSTGDRVPALPRPGSTAALVVFGATAILLLLLGRRAARTAVLTERSSDAVVAFGTVVSVFAFWGIANAHRGEVLWWTSHVLEVVGLAAMCVPAARDLGLRRASRPLVGDLRAADIVADEESFLDGRVHHLMLQLGRKDDVTEGHTRRVATLAVRMGEQLGLDPTSLRDLAAGGLLHDIGKLGTPDGILKKPSRLTDAEYEVIKQHPAEGRRILDEVGRFNPRILHLVEAHHERLDGGGYPNGRPGAELDIGARILAVADVFDALTSQRPYRVAWPADRALEVIERESGNGFDPACVDALREVLRRGRATRAARRVPKDRHARGPGRAA